VIEQPNFSSNPATESAADQHATTDSANNNAIGRFATHIAWSDDY
jgi:hypothetical protein